MSASPNRGEDPKSVIPPLKSRAKTPLVLKFPTAGPSISTPIRLWRNDELSEPVSEVTADGGRTRTASSAQSTARELKNVVERIVPYIFTGNFEFDSTFV